MTLLRKLALLLKERLPGKRVFFVYTHKNGYDRFHNGLKANTEISYFCFRALERAFPRISFLKWAGEKKERIAKIGPQDVVIGHVGETFLKASERTKRLISFCPWVGHEDHSTSISPASVSKEIEMNYYNKAASLILLTSEFNQRNYLQKPTNFWHPYFEQLKREGKRVRVVHQPVDLEIFKRIKWDYTTSDFLYIGNTNHMKAVPDSIRLVESVGRKLHLFGTGERSLNHLDKKLVATLPALADFFIQPGMWEAQNVSILESAARGFIPIVSPDTGYPYDHPYLLRYGDFSYNLQIIKKLLKLSVEEKRELGDFLYRQLKEDENHNSWQRLTETLVEEVLLLKY